MIGPAIELRPLLTAERLLDAAAPRSTPSTSTRA